MTDPVFSMGEKVSLVITSNLTVNRVLHESPTNADYISGYELMFVDNKGETHFFAVKSWAPITQLPKCKKCNLTLSSKDKFCPSCGEKQ